MQKKMKLTTRMMLGSGVILTIALGMIGFSLYNMNQLNANMAEVIHETHHMQLAYKIQDSFRKISEGTKFIALLKNGPRKEREIVKVRTELQWKYFNEFKKGKLTPQEQTVLAKMEKVMEVVKTLVQQMIELDLANRDTEAADINEKTGTEMEGLYSMVEEFVKLQEETNKKEYDTALKVSSDSFNLLVGLSVLTIILGICLTFFISRGITGPVNKIISSLTEGANQVAAASGQLSASAQQLSQGSAEQASAIEETSTSIQESSAMLQQSNANTGQAAQLAEQSKEFADKGNLEMQQMMNSMEEIKKSSNQIAKIIKVIDDIAFQTNILALNAAIEAARAGEAGMGFGVVAEEVRNLAQRSAQAAQETAAIIEANITISGEGVKGAERVRNTLDGITNQARKVNELMSEVAAASKEQLLGIEQVNAVMSQVEIITEQNASTAEESAASAEELSAQAANLNRIVQDLSLLFNRKANKIKADSGVNGPSHFDQNSNSLTNKTDNRMKIVTPEDIIPLEKDPNHF